ncbi:type II toxin-antitoxin system RelE/ParE family toxin [Nanoarchaeota archaeon]
MQYELVWSPKIRNKLKKLDKKISLLIIKKIFSIQDNPIPYLKKLKQISHWRLRVGDYRVVLDLDLANKKIIVLNLGHRKNIY